MFKKEESEGDGGKLNIDWGWVGIVFSLAGDDLTKVKEITEEPVLLTFNWLLYKKDQQQMEQTNNKIKYK